MRAVPLLRPQRIRQSHLLASPQRPRLEPRAAGVPGSARRASASLAESQPGPSGRGAARAEFPAFCRIAGRGLAEPSRFWANVHPRWWVASELGSCTLHAPNGDPDPTVKTFSAAVLATLVLAAETASATSLFHPDLVEAVDQLAQARGPEAYAALRAVWDTWDRADPDQVEEVLSGAARDARLSRPAQAYAGLLGPTRVSVAVTSPRRRAPRGRSVTVERWMVVGPSTTRERLVSRTAFGPEPTSRRPSCPDARIRAKSGQFVGAACPTLFRSATSTSRA